MRPALLLSIPLFFTACSQAPPLEPERSAPVPKPAPAEIAKPPAVAATPTSPAVPPKVIRTEISGISFEGVSFHSSSHHLVVVDQPGGPGSKFADAKSAGSSLDGLVAVNAGFFTPEGAPLGKVVAGGKAAGAWNRSSSLGAGVFLENASGELSIVRREAVSGSGQRELVQAGPMLMENGRTVTGLNSEKPATRIFLLWDGGQRWWIGRSSPCTLAQLGSSLGQRSPAGWPIRHALNLDGGRSADFWVSGAVSGGPLNFRSLFNRPVRNFLVLVPR